MTYRRFTEIAGLAYPPWWRDRYGPELSRLADDLVADGRSVPAVACSIAVGGIAVRLSGAGMPPVAALWATRSKWLLSATLLPVLVGTFTVVTVLGKVWTTQLAPRTGLLGRIAGDLWTAGMFTHLAVLVAASVAWHLVWTGARSLPWRRRRLVLAGLLLPFAVLLALSALSTAAGNLGTHTVAVTAHGGRSVSDHPLVASILRITQAVLGYGGMAAFFASLPVALRRLPPASWTLGRGVAIARVIGGGCVALAALVGASGTLAAHAAPLPGWFLSPEPASVPWFWWPCVATLVALALLAFTGAREAARCRHVADRLTGAS